MMKSYQATSSRPANSWNRVASCDNVTISYDWATESGSVLLCQALKKARKPDGAMTFVDDLGDHHIASIYEWANHRPVYTGKFNRPRTTWEDPWKQCEDVRITFARHENGVVKLCRALKAAGKPDGDLLLVEAGVKAEYAMRWYITSIYHYAEYPLVATADETKKAEMAPIGVAEPKTISGDWHRILADLKQGGSLWTDVHGRTKGAMKTQGLVSVVDDTVTMTDAGEQAMALYESAISRGDIVKKDAVKLTNGDVTSYSDMSPSDLTTIAVSFGLIVKTDLAHHLTRIAELIESQTLTNVEAMAAKHGLTIKYGVGRKGDPYKKRLNLVAIINAGHTI